MNEVVNNVNDIDLIDLVYRMLKDTISERIANIYIADPDVSILIGKDSSYQRVLLNRYFRNILLKYCNSPGANKILDTYYLLVDDGSTDDWLHIFKNHVLPFIHQNFVYDKLYPENV